jgi:RNA polymerase sigma-70 factor (ECF subfamily)
MTPALSDEHDRRNMARLAAGQDAALDELMSRHAERLSHYLLRLLQNESEAADVAEEAFVRVYLHRKRFRRGKKFSTWLYTIATNLARDLQRQHARHPQVSLDSQPEGSARDFKESVPETRPGPLETLEASERAETVRLAVAALPEELRVPLILSVYEEQSHAEIAEVLDCSAKAVEMRLYRARQQLRGRLVAADVSRR